MISAIPGSRWPRSLRAISPPLILNSWSWSAFAMGRTLTPARRTAPSSASPRKGHVVPALRRPPPGDDRCAPRSWRHSPPGRSGHGSVKVIDGRRVVVEDAPAGGLRQVAGHFLDEGARIGPGSVGMGVVAGEHDVLV